jgi:ABC-type transport system involved in multi-copper enzyme maturation permease subunit
MLTLLRRDLILNRYVVGLTYPLWSVLWLGGPAMSGGDTMPFGLWSGGVSLACAFLPVMMLIREDKFKAGALVCSLPVTRDAIVASRYLGGWLVALTGVAVAIAAMLALSLFGVRPLRPPTPMLPATVVTVVGLAIALMLPMAIRFGMVGVFGLLIGTQLLGVVVLLAGAMFDARVVQGIEAAVKAIVSGSARLRDALGPAAYSAVLVAAVAVLNYASFRLSSLLYRRREF